MNDLLDRLIDREQVDLYAVGELLSVVLASRRAGIEFDPSSLDQLQRLVHAVDVFSQGSAILDAKDPDAVRDLVRATYREFEADFVRPAWQRRQALLDRVDRGELDREELPHDILMVLLLHRGEAQLELADDGRVVREVATYLQGGTHTSGQTLVNAIDLIFGSDQPLEVVLDRIAGDLLYRATGRPRDAPAAADHAEDQAPGRVRCRARRPVDPRRMRWSFSMQPRPISIRPWFGANPDRFDPDRTIAEGVPRWGLAFGAGAHQCPGRSVAGGFPVPDDFDADDEHVFGLVALMLQAVARRGVRPDPERRPERDTRTERFTRWRHYPVRFDRSRIVVAPS